MERSRPPAGDECAGASLTTGRRRRRDRARARLPARAITTTKSLSQQHTQARNARKANTQSNNPALSSNKPHTQPLSFKPPHQRPHRNQSRPPPSATPQIPSAPQPPHNPFHHSPGTSLINSTYSYLYILPLFTSSLQHPSSTIPSTASKITNTKHPQQPHYITQTKATPEMTSLGVCVAECVGSRTSARPHALIHESAVAPRPQSLHEHTSYPQHGATRAGRFGVMVD